MATRIDWGKTWRVLFNYVERKLRVTINFFCVVSCTPIMKLQVREKEFVNLQSRPHGISDIPRSESYDANNRIQSSTVNRTSGDVIVHAVRRTLRADPTT